MNGRRRPGAGTGQCRSAGAGARRSCYREDRVRGKGQSGPRWEGGKKAARVAGGTERKDALPIGATDQRPISDPPDAAFPILGPVPRLYNRRPMSLDGVIFDLDGTLVDSNAQHVEAWRRAFAERGYKVPPDRIF